MDLYKKQKGFTLIEVLISLSIFVIFLTGVTSVYLDIARKQREANVVKEVYSEIRYVFNLISDEIKANTIDYECYQGPYAPDTPYEISTTERNQKKQSSVCNDLRSSGSSESYLALRDRSGTERTLFKVEDNELYMYKEYYTGSSWLSQEGFNQDEYVEINLKNVLINSFNFEIAPLADPFDPINVSCNAVQFQPSVSIYASITGEPENMQRFSMDLQTSISSRVYNQQTTI